MKYRILITFLLIVTSFTFCSHQQEESKAIAYLNKARRCYYANQFDTAYIFLDSIITNYPTAIYAKKMSVALRDSIKRSESSHRIDRIQEQINACKIEITQNRKNNYKNATTEQLEAQVDSLRKLIIPYRDIVNEITAKELQLAARTQCVTCIKQTRQ